MNVSLNFRSGFTQGMENLYNLEFENGLGKVRELFFAKVRALFFNVFQNDAV